MKKSEFLIRKMDCPSEESIIRLKLEAIAEIKKLDFDIPSRRLLVFHYGNPDKIAASIDSLNFGSSHISTTDIAEENFLPEKQDSILLWQVLIINFGFFIIESVTGFLSHSMGLFSDSLDMLADALVYGLSLFAVKAESFRKKKIATVSGYLQIALAIFGMAEVLKRFLGYEIIPDFKFMIIVATFALAANVACLYLLQKSKSEGVHMKASMIFTANDVIINLGVIIAGGLVYLLHSKYPDLIVGAIVFVIVLKGGFSILKLSK
jgi:Co/Zn/Cd efflux system component